MESSSVPLALQSGTPRGFSSTCARQVRDVFQLIAILLGLLYTTSPPTQCTLGCFHGRLIEHGDALQFDIQGLNNSLHVSARVVCQVDVGLVQLTSFHSYLLARQLGSDAKARHKLNGLYLHHCCRTMHGNQKRRLRGGWFYDSDES